jgi:hypothetical protein
MDQLAYILGSTKWKCWDTLKPICLLRYVVSVICALLVVLKFMVVIFMFTQMFMFMSSMQAAWTSPCTACVPGALGFTEVRVLVKLCN